MSAFIFPGNILYQIVTWNFLNVKKTFIYCNHDNYYGIIYIFENSKNIHKYEL